MNSPQPIKNLCITCEKMAGVFSLQRCSENFCLPHTSVHREFVQESMNEILQNYDQFHSFQNSISVCSSMIKKKRVQVPMQIILLGITSKSVSNISNPYRNPTSYDWTEKNPVYLAENSQHLEVDLRKSPFLWELNVHLFSDND